RASAGTEVPALPRVSGRSPGVFSPRGSARSPPPEARSLRTVCTLPDIRPLVAVAHHPVARCSRRGSRLAVERGPPGWRDDRLATCLRARRHGVAPLYGRPLDRELAVG